MEEFINEFKAEASGIVSNVQQYLLTLETDKNNMSLVDEVFRGVHTLKGSSRMFGFDKIETLTHELENSFDEIKEGVRELSKGLIDTGLEVMDAVTKILEGSMSDEEFAALKAKVVSKDFGEEDSDEVKGGLYQVLYHPDKDVYLRGVKPMIVFMDLEDIGEIQKHTIYQGRPLEEQEESKEFESKFEVLISLNADFDELEDVFLFMGDNEYSIHQITSDAPKELESLANNVTEALEGLTPGADFSEERLEFIQANLVSKDTVPQEKAEESKIDSVEQEGAIKVDTPTPKSDASIDYINVKLDRLDQMMRLLSELVTVKAELSFAADELNDQRLINSVEKLDKIANKFKDNAFSMRLVPLQILSLKFQRLIRDISGKLGKEVKLITEGLDTEIDKSIISEIEGPLVHIIQNAIDHGLETPEEREAIGKNREGLLKIVAFYAGASVFIMVQDDGKGLNTDKIREKAISKGLISEADVLTEKDLIDLIFKPGFTTHSTATNYSGRGVGMDVVMQKIKLLRGSIDVTTEENLGSSFTIRLPLSLSIIDVLHVKVDDINYLIPQSEIEQCFSERLHNTIIQKKGHNLNYEGKLIPHVDLSEVFENESPSELDKSIIVIQKNDKRISLEVEEIVGYAQLVVKPMDDTFRELPYLTGVSVLGSGDLAFMLDGLKLSKHSFNKVEVK